MLPTEGNRGVAVTPTAGFTTRAGRAVSGQECVGNDGVFVKNAHRFAHDAVGVRKTCLRIHGREHGQQVEEIERERRKHQTVGRPGLGDPIPVFELRIPRDPVEEEIQSNSDRAGVPGRQQCHLGRRGHLVFQHSPQRFADQPDGGAHGLHAPRVSSCGGCPGAGRRRELLDLRRLRWRRFAFRRTHTNLEVVNHETLRGRRHRGT